MIDPPKHNDYPESLACNRLAEKQAAKDYCNDLGYNEFYVNYERDKSESYKLGPIPAGKIELFCSISHYSEKDNPPPDDNISYYISACKDQVDFLTGLENLKKEAVERRLDSCKEIGFKENTVDMSHCLLKMIELERISNMNDIQKTQIVIPEEQKGKGSGFNWAAFAAGLNQLNNSLYGGTGTTTSTSTTCFSTGEYTKGMNKVCQYSCVGSAHAITVGAAQMCPVSVQR